MDPPGIDLRVHADCVSDDNPQINPHDHEALADLEYLASGQDKLAPIAVIGFSLKFPQDATSPEGFWKILSEGRSAMTEVPSDHFNIDAFYSPDAGKNDCMNNRGGHFITENLATFDAPFFSISSAEAACMDPQQRGLLETTFRALESAGLPMERVVGSDTSVYIGSFTKEFETILAKDSQMHEKYMATGTGTSMLANRLSWFYDLKGPSLALDTACSSSLNAVHLACQSLRNKESSLGIVGGCNLCYNPDSFISLSNRNFLSPDSKCYSFDSRANGYARGEGFGIVILKPLLDALRDDDTIRAVIRASGSNQDGKTPGITNPSKEAQVKVVRKTYEEGGLDLRITRFLEAHGTGTVIGDSVEAAAIAEVFKDKRSRDGPLYVGALKSNLGHLEGASGVAGLIKAILVLEKGIIPPNIWFDEVNPKISADEWNLKFPVECTLWPTTGLRRASVSSYGYGGSNAHVVLDDAYNYLQLRGLIGNHVSAKDLPSLSTHSASHLSADVETENTAEDGTTFEPKILVWSAADNNGLKRVSEAYQDHICKLNYQRQDGEYFSDLAYTLACKRSFLPWRGFIVARSVDELGKTLEQSSLDPTRSTHIPALCFIFTGQGAQWPSMADDLLAYPLFKRSLEDADAYFHDLGCTWSLLAELEKTKETSEIHNPALSQPICTALQVALVELLRSWDIFPSAVLGHSSGEIAAAYTAGGLSRESAWKVAFYRGSLSARIIATGDQERGAMMAVDLSENEAEIHLRRNKIDQNVTIGCENSPRNITLTGSEAEIDRLKPLLERDGIQARKLQVNVAYHSRYMEKVSGEYRRLIHDIKPGELSPRNPDLFSSLTGGLTSVDQCSHPEYWTQNLVSKVRFRNALSQMCSKSRNVSEEDKPIELVIEIGPHAVLRRPVKETLADISETGIKYYSMLERGISARHTSLQVAGSLFCSGYPVNLRTINHYNVKSSNLHMLVDLPEYPFDRNQKYWIESRVSDGFRFRHQPRNELLGTPSSDWNPLQACWRNFIRASEIPWIRDHKVNGSIVYPAAGMLVMAIEAARQACDSARVISGYEIRDAVFFNALLCGQTAQGVETKFYLTPLKDASDKTRAWSSFRLCSYQKGVWIDNCQGMVAVACRDEENEVDCGTEVKAEHIANQKLYDSGVENCRLGLRFKKLYEILDMLGLNYGPCFQVISEVSYNHDGEAVGKIKLRGTQTTGVSTLKGPIIHPTALDGVLQLAFPALSKGGDRHIPTMAPMRIQHFWVSAALQHQSSDGHIKAYAKAVLQGLREANSSIVALDANNVPRLKVEGFQSIAVVSQRNILESQHNWKRICYNIDWKPDMDLISNQKITALCKTAHVSDIGQDRLRDEMELACFIFISEVVDAIARQNIQPTQSHLGKYVKWMRKMIESQQADSIRFRQDWQNILNDAAYKRQFLDHINMTGPEGKFYVEINKCLLGILQGQTDSLEILFGGSLVADYYRATNYGSKAALEPFFDALAHKNPGLEVLEVGAGTGSATLSILEILAHHGGYECGNPRFAHYTFTDLSAGFFGKAGEEFGEQSYGRMIFKTLDIEIDPAKQGFNEGTYDVVVASNVIHATQSLDNALKNVRKLLKPNGKFVLLEVTNSDIFRVGFVFGLLPGWWYGREDFRQSGPTVTEEKWHELLLRNGFTGLDTSIRDSENSHNYIGSLMISTAAESHPENPCLPALMLIADCCSSLQSNVALEAKSVFDTSSSTSCRIITPSEVLQTDLSTTFCIFLLELESPILANINAENYARLQKIISTAQGLLWVTGQSTNKPELEMVSGLSRCVRAENAAFKFITLAVENISTIAENMVTVLKALHYCSANSIEEYREMDGLLCINRAVEANYVNDHIHSQLAPSKANPFKLGEEPLRALSLGIACPGLLDTLEFVEDATPHNVLASDEVEVEVKVCGMNFLDIMVALGQVSNDYLGVECSGVVRQLGRNDGPLRIGDRVCCCAPGTFRTLIRCKSEGVWQIPDTVTFHEAAALPVVFSTAYHALYNVARIQHGESILIHFGAGGMGQATIQLAKLFNAEIFATVGTAEKKNLLISLYGIPESHIFSSRNLSFRQGIKRMTKGCGVDIAINALAGEGLLATWECMAPFGRFIEIGKKDIYSHSNLPMFQFAKNVTFAAVDLNYMIREATKLLVPIMRSVLDLAAEKKIHAPKPIHVYAASQTIEAFRYLQSGKNTGKTVIEFKAEDVVPAILQRGSVYSLDKNVSYLIAGGLGGLGRSIARWMFCRGARNLILLSRRGPDGNSRAKELIEELKEKGVTVMAPRCDVTSADSLVSVLMDCGKEMPPIQGCIQGSMVLKDGTFENMSFDSFRAAVEPKVKGSWNLHTLLPRGMNFFILLSSVTGVFGGQCQANYACGNTYQDGLARYRVSNGEKAVSLDLGLMSSVGFAAEHQTIFDSLQSKGLIPISEPEFHAMLDYYCNPLLDNASVLKSQVLTGLSTPGTRDKKFEEPYWATRPLFRHLLHMNDRMSDGDNNTTTEEEAQTDFKALLRSAQSFGNAAFIAHNAIVWKLSRALLIPLGDIDAHKPMHSYGVDSLVAVELRNWLLFALNADVAVFDILGSGSIAELGLMVARKSDCVSFTGGEN